MSRRRPLHTCGASLLAVTHTAWRKTQELNGPLGKWARRITKCMSLALPLVYVLLYQWLAILSFTDDCILKFEKLVEAIFPPSTCLFDKIDNLLYIAEALPGRFDEALNKFLSIIYRVPFLDWVLIQSIWWFYGNPTEEKDIMIDMNSNIRSDVTEPADNANWPTKEATSENKEKLVSVMDSMEKKTYNGKYTGDSMNQSGDLLSAPLVDSSQGSVNLVRLPSINAASVGGSSEDGRKSIGHVEFPSIAGGSSQENRVSEDHVQLPSTAKKKVLHRNQILEDDHSHDKNEPIVVKLESAKQTEAENTPEQEGSLQSSNKEKGTQQSIKGKDPVLELFESRWLL